MKKFFLSALLSISLPLFTRGQAGLPDPTFDGDGITIFDDATGFGTILSIGLQSDGKIIIAGRMTTDSQYNNWVFYRFTPAGKHDSTFGVNGKASIDFLSDEDFGCAVAIQGDNKIVACGLTKVGGLYYGVIARLTADGSLDNSFNGSGKVILSYASELDGIALEPGGNIVVVGRANDVNTNTFLIRRFLTDGSIDASFIPTNLQISTYNWANACVISPDGKIFVSGITYDNQYNQRFVVLKYNSGGSIDTTYGMDGVATVDFDEFSEEDEPYLALDPEGRIVISGYGMETMKNDVVLARFTTDGILDSTFSNDGKLTTDVFGYVDRGRAVTIQPDGKILVTGYARENILTSGVVLIRYNDDGSLDTPFANNGIAYNSFDESAEGWDLLLQPDGKILVSAYGYLNNGYITEVAVLRFLNDIALNTEDVTISKGSRVTIYPNPLHDLGMLEFSLAGKESIAFDLFDLEGRKIKRIAEGDFSEGDHRLFFQREGLNDGIYFLQLKSGHETFIRKMLIE